MTDTPREGHDILQSVMNENELMIWIPPSYFEDELESYLARPPTASQRWYSGRELIRRMALSYFTTSHVSGLGRVPHSSTIKQIMLQIQGQYTLVATKAVQLIQEGGLAMMHPLEVKKLFETKWEADCVLKIGKIVSLEQNSQEWARGVLICIADGSLLLAIDEGDEDGCGPMCRGSFKRENYGNWIVVGFEYKDVQDGWKLVEKGVDPLCRGSQCQGLTVN
ncbi:hypothetical protein ACEPPN_000356 [Leptodophora sp. 'Broadleaf-Isolate-01']